MVLLAILTAVPFILFSQRNEFKLFSQTVLSEYYKIDYNNLDMDFHFDNDLPIFNNFASFRSIEIDNNKSPFFNNMEIGLRYDLPYGGLGLFFQFDTKSFFAPNIWFSNDIPYNRILVRGGLKFNIPFLKIVKNSSTDVNVSYGVVSRSTQQDSNIVESGPVTDQWGNYIGWAEGSIDVIKTSYWTFGPSISAGIEYKLNKRFQINAELGMSYVMSSDGDTHDSIYPLLQFGIVNTYW
jgi:hypothetical protein